VSETVTGTAASGSKANEVRVRVARRFELSCGHHIPNHPGKCRTPHGHNYIVEVVVEGPLNGMGMVADFADVKDVFLVAVGKYDHKNLNDFFFTPTAEVLAVQWLQALRDVVDQSVQSKALNADWTVIGVRVWETSDCYAEALA